MVRVRFAIICRIFTLLYNIFSHFCLKWYHLLPYERVEDKGKDIISQSIALVDRHQENSTKLLRDRTHDVYRLKTTLERAIKAQMDEISNLAEQRNRMMQALTVLQKPASIGE